MLGIYIHVPFCAQKCSYCDFFSVTNPSHIVGYVDALVDEIKKVGARYASRDTVIDTLYIGGGTPSVLPFDAIKLITDTVKTSFNCQFREVTMEVNPCMSEDVPRYKECGIDRLSFGVQSLKDDVLKTLGRRHNSAEALAALQLAKSCGYRVSADLMLGVPGESDEDVADFITTLAPIVDHISAYILKVEERTPLYRAVEAGKIVVPSDDSVADTYRFAVQKLADAGFARYEISNFSKPNEESIHNLKYWTRDDYLGFGPAAHSFTSGRRYYNLPNLKEYCLGVHSGNGLGVEEEDTSVNVVEEALMLGLRLENGVDIAQFNKRYNVDIVSQYSRQIERMKDFIEVTDDGRLRIKDEGFLLQNQVLTTLFS